MTRRRLVVSIAAAAIAIGGISLVSPQPANALNLLQPLCTAAGWVSGVAGKACSLVSGVSGGGGGISSSTTTALTLAAVVAWVVGGARFVLHATAHVIGETTSPQLTSTWFSATYWHVAGIAAILTLPFLFAAAMQALARSDVTLLIRAVAGYLPVAFLSVAIAAPVTMLLLSASDEMSAVVGTAAGQESTHFLRHGAALLGVIAATISSPFVVFLIGLLTVIGALVLWMELLVRAAAVYVIVLLLPMAFAAFVWPARRIWAIRSIELLIALILSKFAIVAVLSLGGAALDHSANGRVTGLLAGAVLMALAAFAPWAMLRLIPLAEIGAAAMGSLRGSANIAQRLRQSDAWAAEGVDWAAQTAQMRDAATGAAPSDGARAMKEDADANSPRAPGTPASSFGRDAHGSLAAGGEEPAGEEPAVGEPSVQARGGDGAAPPADAGGHTHSSPQGAAAQTFGPATAAPEPAPPPPPASAWNGDRPLLDIESEPHPDDSRPSRAVHEGDLRETTPDAQPRPEESA